MSDPLAQVARVMALVAPHADATVWSPALAGPMRASGITTPRRIAMFLGQCAEESGGFMLLEESLYYTSAEHIREVWPSRFPTLADAAPFVADPEYLADHVYAARMGNGDPMTGDGWRFRGRGLIQLTGRTLYAEFAHVQGRDVDEIADWLVTPEGAAASACWYWAWAYHGNLNALADAWDVLGATRLINGGETDLARRVLLCGAALSVFIPPTPPETPTITDKTPTITDNRQIAAREESEADKLNDAELARLHALEGSKSG